MMDRCISSVYHVRTAAHMCYCHYAITCFYQSYREAGELRAPKLYAVLDPDNASPWRTTVAGCIHILKSTEVKDKTLDHKAFMTAYLDQKKPHNRTGQ